MAQNSTQVFFWMGQGEERDGRTHYQSFALNNATYSIGDCVFLFPEHESSPHYVGRIKGAFIDEASGLTDPHCIEIKWYERRTNLETNTRGIEESEREVFELEETDVNPIGCISGKCHIIKARTFDEAYQATRHLNETWFFCRGYFLQASNRFQPYTPAELAEPAGPLPPPVPMNRVNSSSMGANMMHSDLSEDDGRGGHYTRPPPPKRKATGRVCMECGATSTPQWREGPNGPKTLCNACGVRYVRAQQRANKRPGGGGGKGGGGGGHHHRDGGHGTGPSGGGGGGGGGGSGAARYGSSPRVQKHHKAEKHEDPPTTKHADSSRPVRQAALAAASRTAAFARTGEFPEDEQEEAPAGGRAGGNQKRHRSGAGSHDSSMVSTGADSADEMYEQSGGRGAQAKRAGPQPGLGRSNGAANNKNTDAAAAVNLLALSNLASGEMKLENRTGSPRAAAAAAGNAFQGPRAAGLPNPDLVSVLANANLPGASPSKLALGSSPRVGGAAGSTHFPLGMGLGISGLGTGGTGAASASGDAATAANNGTGGSTAAAFDPAALVGRINTRPPGSPPHTLGAAAAATGAAAGMSPLALPAGSQPELAVPPLLRLPSPTPLGGTNAAGSPLLGSTPALNAAHLAIIANQGEFHNMAVKATKYFPELVQYQDLFCELDNITGELPAEVLKRLHEVREKVDSASKDAAAAEAAVQAVSHVMQMRQEAADRAKESATKAGQQLKDYLTGLINSHAAAANSGASGTLPPPAPLDIGELPAAPPLSLAQPSAAAAAPSAAAGGGGSGAGGGGDLFCASGGAGAADGLAAVVKQDACLKQELLVAPGGKQDGASTAATEIPSLHGVGAAAAPLMA